MGSIQVKGCAARGGCRWCPHSWWPAAGRPVARGGVSATGGHRQLPVRR